MTFSLESEHREFARVGAAIAVDYRFYSDLRNDLPGDACPGTTSNLGAGGLLLQGPLPDPAWVPDLLLGKIQVALALRLPGGAVKALARVAWIEDPRQAGGPWLLGLKFREITAAGRDRILQHVIDARTPGW
jgi:hypothetical protein